jgi:hypothetical protein
MNINRIKLSAHGPVRVSWPVTEMGQHERLLREWRFFTWPGGLLFRVSLWPPDRDRGKDPGLSSLPAGDCDRVAGAREGCLDPKPFGPDGGGMRTR